MNRALLATIVALAAVAPGCSQTFSHTPEAQQLQARDAYERGLGHFRAGETVLALTALQEAVRLDPDIAVYHNSLGLLYLQQMGNPQLALTEFNRAVQLDPKYAEGHLDVGIALAEQQRWADATTAYRRALELPTLTVPDIAHQNLGLALYNLKRYPEAEAELRFALSLDPKMQAAYYHLGLVFLAQNRADDARIAFRHARDLGPTTAFGDAAVQRLRALGDPG
jgi:Tfp pilus assembly protein PilF